MFKRNGIYQFKKRVPLDLVKHYEKEFIQKSLGTRDAQTAKRLNAELEAKYLQEFERIRLRKQPSLTELKEIATNYYYAEKLYLSNGAASKWRAQLAIKRSLTAEKGHVLDSVEEALNYLNAHLMGSEYDVVYLTANELIDEHKLQLDKCADLDCTPDPLYLDFCRYLLEATVRAHQDYLNPKTELSLEDVRKIVGITLSELLDEHFDEMPEVDSKSKIKRAVARFTAFLGDVDIGLLTKQKVREYKRWFLEFDAKLASSLSSNKKQKDWREIHAKCLQIPEAEREPYKLKTFTEEISAMRVMLDDYAVTEFDQPKYLESNPFNFTKRENLKLHSGFASATRVPYSKEQMKQIFTDITFLNPDYGSENFWGVLMLVYTAARPCEVASIAIDEVHSLTFKDEQIYYFDVPQSKTEAGERPVPIHSDLIKLGFLDYYEKRKREGNMLFPNWGKYNWNSLSSNGVSKWFNGDFLPRLGIKFSGKPESGKYKGKSIRVDGYSARHTTQDAWKSCGVSQSDIESLVGHAISGKANKYGQGEDVIRRYENVSKLDTSRAWGFDLVATIKSGKLVKG